MQTNAEDVVTCETAIAGLIVTHFHFIQRNVLNIFVNNIKEYLIKKRGGGFLSAHLGGNDT